MQAPGPAPVAQDDMLAKAKDHGSVMLSGAKHLESHGGQILRFAQDDKFRSELALTKEGITAFVQAKNLQLGRQSALILNSES